MHHDCEPQRQFVPERLALKTTAMTSPHPHLPFREPSAKPGMWPAAGKPPAAGAWEPGSAYEADRTERRRYWYTVSRLNPYSRASWAFGIPAAAWAANSLTWSGSRARLRPW